jgi:LmbE family N-acetylglucosaminyl deacetylase
MKILIIGSHPDDEVLGVAGTLIKHRNSNHKLFIHILTDGHSSRVNQPQYDIVKIDKRVVSAQKVAEYLNVDDLYLSSYKDQRLDTIPMIEIVHEIESYAKKIKPDVVYTHHRGDVNFDHKKVFEASLNAFRSVGDNYPKGFFCYETVSATEWGSIFSESAFIPNYFVDITNELDKKMEVLELYRDELRKFPHPRSIEGIKITARKWGSVIGVNAAEAFVQIRNIWK